MGKITVDRERGIHNSSGGMMGKITVDREKEEYRTAVEE